MSLNAIELAAKAKINLSLDITGIRENGYHELCMLMQSVELYDTVRLERDDMISVRTNLYYLPVNRQNIAYRIAERFFEKTGITGGARISITKRIPVAAGLAGGSTDGAAVLKGLNRLYETGLTMEEMCELALPVGSDIPFCLRGGTMLTEGIGEKLTRVPSIPKCHILLCKPSFGISTEAAFREFDTREKAEHPNTPLLLKALAEGDLETLAGNMKNVLADMARPNHRDIGAIEERMKADGALGAVMSGSGPTVFGIFRDKEAALKSYHTMRKSYREVFLASPEYCPVEP
ncbi:MAG: 4-(cytidine 5'-diphospho)-2-C-methyl-D-erythritol kinase [Clostridia bacterium]|nr:4-(cytidine 5'-diphospho)-2-C-methyl-D-erythritol kinase [Clostridia bacterium]